MQSNLFDFDTAFERNGTFEDSKNDITSRKIKIRSKIKFENKLKRESVNNLVDELPLESESLHIISNGSFDYFTLVPAVIEMTGSQIEEFYFSTWTMSHNNVIQILDLYDRNYIKNINALTGEYFKTRESTVYNILNLGCEERGQRVVASKNHSKITLLKTEKDFYVIEGSANFTANPRIEQFTLINSEGLFNFHKEWMDSIFIKNGY